MNFDRFSTQLRKVIKSWTLWLFGQLHTYWLFFSFRREKMFKRKTSSYLVRLVVPRVIKKNKTKKLFLWTLHTNSHPHTETGLDKIKMTVSITMFESFLFLPFSLEWRRSQSYSRITRRTSRRHRQKFSLWNFIGILRCLCKLRGRKSKLKWKTTISLSHSVYRERSFVLHSSWKSDSSLEGFFGKKVAGDKLCQLFRSS